jgi:DNA polymerase theta
MEMTGVSIDRTQLTTLAHEMSSLMKKVEEKIFQLNGKRFNLSSTIEVAKVLGIHKNIAARSRPSTSKQVLEKIETPMANWIMQYRKLEATHCKTLTPVSRVVSGDRIYGNSFCFTSTGRVSMHEPNLQNVAKDFTIELSGGVNKILIIFSISFNTLLVHSI